MLDKILKFLNDNKDALGWLFGSGIVLAVLGGIYRFIVWLFKEYRLRKIRSNESFPFKIIPPNSNVAKEILGGADDDPLADRNIPYQQRIQGRNTRRELEELIEDNRWILITGRTGLGKTREAVQLAQSLNNEGWTILYLTREAWLDAPAKLPSNAPERKLVFFLDDLNKKCHSSKAEIRPDIGESLTLPMNEPFQTRLQRTIEAFDTFCGKSEIRIIATARNEKTSEFDEPSEWEKLAWSKYSDLWGKFNLVDLSEPDKAVEQKLLAETAKKVDIQINPNDLPILAKRNDGTFRNLVENLSYARIEGFKLSSESFRDTLKGTWEKRYQRAVQKFPEAKHIYDAIELIRLAGIDLKPSNIVSVAIILSSNKGIEKIAFRSRCYNALKHLEKSENILEPRDGQIEAKGYRISLENHLRNLYVQIAQQVYSGLREKIIFLIQILLLPQTYFLGTNFSYRLMILNNFVFASSSLNNVGIAYRDLGYFNEALFFYEQSIKLKQKEIRKLFTRKSLARSWGNKGRALFYLKRFDEAIFACNKAIEFDKKNSWVWCILGDIYSEIKDYENAVNAFNKAIQISPKWATPWIDIGFVYTDLYKYEEAINAFEMAAKKSKKWAAPWNALGYVYMRQARYDDALTAYQKAISLAPKWALPWNNLSYVYSDLRQVDNAIEACQKAIALSPKSAASWINLAEVCVDSKRFNEAKGACQKAIELNSNDTKLWNRLGWIYKDLSQTTEAIQAFQKAIDLDPNSASPWNGLGHMYRDRDRYDEAIQAFQKAIDLDPNFASPWNGMGYTLGNLGSYDKAIQTFQKAIELDQKFASPWNGLGNAYRYLTRYDEAIQANQKAIELDPKYGSPWKNLGIIYSIQKQHEKALSAYQKASELEPTDSSYQISIISALKKLGQNTEASEQEEITRKLIGKEEEYNRACFESICGNTDEALRLLKLALEQKQIDLEWAQQDPDFDCIRDDPRFKELFGLE